MTDWQARLGYFCYKASNLGQSGYSALKNLLSGSYFLRTTVNTDPFPGELSQETLPLSSSQILFTIERPRPVDASPAVVREEILLYLEKRWGNSSAWMPTPSSRIRIWIASFSSLTLIHTCLPAAVY